MSELRAWVLAQLLYNPYQDDRVLIKEFLEGYYGAAADKIRQYMDLMYAASKGYYSPVSLKPRRHSITLRSCPKPKNSGKKLNNLLQMIRNY
jgi:hypothetical protein